MVSRFFKRILCAALIFSLLIPTYVLEAKAEEVIIEDEILENTSEEVLPDTLAENKEIEGEISDDEIIDDEITADTLSATKTEPFFGYREIDQKIDFERLSDAVDSDGMSLCGEELPSSYITPNLPLTRNQNLYGTCWAHSAMALAEIGLKDSSLDFSELQFAYFTYHTPQDPLGGLDGDSNGIAAAQNFLSFGGDTVAASNVLTNWIGAVDEKDVPYSDCAAVLNNTKIIDSSMAFNDVAHVQGYYHTDPKDDRAATKRLIKECGAVGASYYALKYGYMIGAYKYDDVYNQFNSCYYMPLNNTGTNHAVTLVGWDDNYSASNFNVSPPGDGAWLVRNSWESGRNINDRDYDSYFWLSYYDCSLSKRGIAYEVEYIGNYDNNYQYDGSMMDVYISGGLTYANAFKAVACSEGELLKAVSFATNKASLKYTVKIYSGVNTTNPSSGTLRLTQTGYTKDAGCYTVTLNKSIVLENGERFSVLISFDDTSAAVLNEGTYYDGNYNCVAHIDAGESFFKSGSTWYDYSNNPFITSGNLRIKAFTQNIDSGDPITCEVTFDANGGECQTASKTVTYRQNYGDLPTAVKYGYDFVGWFTEKDGGNLVVSTTDVENEKNHSLYAHFEPKSVTVSFDMNGGKSASGKALSSIKVKYDDTYSGMYDPSTIIKQGYHATGWYSQRSGGELVDESTIVRKESAHTLYIHWEPNEYTIRFDPTGGKCTCISKPVEYASTYGAFPVATREGYDFAGWFTLAEGGTRVTANHVYKIADDSTLFAHWNSKSIKVNFDVNTDGADCSEEFRNIAFNDSYNTLPIPTKKGYDFLGWYTDKTDGSRIESTSVVNNPEEHTLYAHWRRKTFDVNFDINGSGAICTQESKSVTFNENYGELPTPERTGYIFDGFYTDRIGGDKVTKYTIVTADCEHTLYAHWKACEYIVTFDTNGEEASCYPSSKVVTYGLEYGELPILEDGSKYFEGWFDQPDGGVEITDKSLVNIADEHTLYAHWSDKPQGLWIKLIDDSITYTGSAIKPAVEIYDGTTLLVEKVDYTLSYKNNTNAGNEASKSSAAPTVIVSGKGNYKGSDKAFFEILPKSIEDKDVIISEPATVIFNKKEQKPVPVITYGKKKLAANKDYTVIYYKSDEYEMGNYIPIIPQEPGDYVIELTAKAGGNYSGTVLKTFTIAEADKIAVSKLLIKKIPDKQYTGSAVYPDDTDIVVQNKKEILENGTDYTVSYIDGDDYRNIGTKTVVITGLGKYVGKRSVTYKVIGREMKSVKIEGFEKAFDYGYGTEDKVQNEMELTYKEKGASVEEEILWIFEEEYNDIGDEQRKQYGCIVSYMNNQNAGTATMVLTGINGYAGTVKKTFKINPYIINSPDEAMQDRFKIEVDTQYYYEKSGTKPEPTVTFDGKKLEKGKDYTVSYSNNTNTNDKSNPKKLPTIKISGKGNFKGTDITTTFIIAAAKLNDSNQGIVVSAPDKVYANKAGNWKTSVSVKDAKGKKLALKNDYLIEYTYVKSVTVIDGKTKLSQKREAGTEVQDKDIVPAGTEIAFSIYGSGKKYDSDRSCDIIGSYRVVAKDINKLKASIRNIDRPYTGKPILISKSDIIWKGETPADSDYEIAGYLNNVNKGKASVILKASEDSNYGGSKTLTFNIGTKTFLWWSW